MLLDTGAQQTITWRERRANDSRMPEELEAFRDKLRTRTLETALGGRRERAIQAERALEVTLEGEASGPATD